MCSPGILYFLTNPSMPGLVKIGYTTGKLGVRLQQLSSTGVPSPFEVVATFYVKDSKRCEAAVHAKLHSYRDNPKREFFSAGVDVLLREAIEEIIPFLDGNFPHSSTAVQSEEFSPDENDIYFMFYLLHDCYQQGTSYSSKELAEHHRDYTPITLDLKLMTLETHGFVKRVNRPCDGIGRWILLPKGVKFMIENDHHDQSLLDT
ncbi:GIY-YIG nuclease family protein [Leptolyngbya iicbica]|nr:GIY-YIG nuclease family protein [Leptolyngbya sp. LK]